jgi:prepilin-type N-terminal cleavage/methylation domain-containing protein
VLKKIFKGLTIIELLVVLAVLGVFVSFAYPNISNWIKDREVKKEVYETVIFIKERKKEVTSGKYGMTQVLLNRQLQVFTMTPERYFQIYKGFNSPYPTHKQNYTCGFGDTAGFIRQNQYDVEDFGVYVPDSNVHIYPSAWHNPMRTAFCITKDGSIEYDKQYQNFQTKDEATGSKVDAFVFCSKSNTTESTCKYNSSSDYRYMITLDRFQNIKVFKYSKKYTKNNGWMLIDG